MQDKHEPLGEDGALPGAPNGPPASGKVALELHELVHLFPPMSEAEFADLKADIQKNGLREPLWTYQGKVIDGRNRLRACMELGIVPATHEWNGVGSVLDFVVSL